MTPTRRGTPDFFLLVLTFVLVGFGLVMVFSSSPVIGAKEFGDSLYFTKRQFIFAGIGTLGMLIIMNIPTSKLRILYVPYFILTIIMLLIVPFVSPEINGARSWFYIGSFGIQPTEFAKLAVIMYLASIISKKGERFRDFNTGLLPVILMVGLVSTIIMLQPDLGSTLILLMCALVIIIAGGANLKHLLLSGALVTGLAGTFFSIYVLAGKDFGYRANRIKCFLDPWVDRQDACYQLVQSLLAFGHGGVFGAGIGQSIQKLHYLPYAYNDFIFAVIAEELGFIGSAIFILLYTSFIWRGLIISLRCPDMFGTLTGIGIMTLIGIQALINIGGVTGTIPSTGVTLPFISYGGSSIIVTLAAMGIVLSISRESAK